MLDGEKEREEEEEEKKKKEKKKQKRKRKKKRELDERFIGKGLTQCRVDNIVPDLRVGVNMGR